ncbi:MAG: CHASE domain-containing protein [Rhodocyclaceae bacterium]|nr:CHASE domain-containing protein [Rhodocyclaceae bacterium]
MPESTPESSVPFGGKAALPRRCKWILVATFFMAYAFAASIATYIHMAHLSSKRFSTQMLAQEYAQRIQERLQTALVSTHVLASVVRQSNGQLRNFNDVATDLLSLFPSVSALQLAPDGVIREVYPLEGNQAAIGHDLLSDSKRNREAVAAITTRQLTLAGPFNLIQGGVGAVGRMPVFLVDERGDSNFWGFAIALIRIPHLLESAGLDGLARSGYRYELWRTHPDTEQKHVFASSGAVPEDPAEYVVTIFNGRWILSISPAAGWITMPDYIEIFGIGLIGALIITGFQYLALRILLRGVHRF